ncbi:MAG: glycosyltransferase family 2 protein [Leptolyngbyaceae cyanobacterium SM1_3_5]|nr:glycosyltransferase family 2 protein [Leptolyngbyaceae cyanobacterium SM1_3_5]
MQNQPTIATVIVTYNAREYIGKCIDSLYKSSVSTAIIVVDNNSSDGTDQIVQNNFPEVKLIQSSVNLGFGKANNIGINWALANQAEFVFLLNQDAWLEEDALSEMLAVAAANPDYGILSPLHLQYDSQSWHQGFHRYVKLFAPALLEAETELSTIYEVNFVPAALWMMNSTALKKAGGFDPIYFMYGEDDDLAARIRAAGFKVGVASSAKGHHMEKSISDRGISVKRLAAKYFGHYTAVLKHSKHNVIYRYLSITKSVIQDILTHSSRGSHKEAKARILAFWNILQIIPKIELSRQKICCEGAFLNIVSAGAIDRENLDRILASDSVAGADR